MNPKAITMGRLYWSFDLVSHELERWGIGEYLLSDLCGSIYALRENELYFNGPVDAVWIEIGILCLMIIKSCV